MTNYYEPKILRGVIKKTLPLRTFFKTRFFSNNVLFPTDKVSFEFQENERRLAPFVNPYIGSEAIARDGYSVKTYETPYIAPVRVITNDTIAQKLLGEQPYNSGITPEERAAEIAANDIRELQDAILRREEYMCARLKQDGKLEIKGRGVNEIVDYGFTNIKKITTANERWSEDFDILGQLAEVAQELARGGVVAGLVILGIDAAGALLHNKKFLRLMDNRKVDIGEIKPSELENGVSYLGRVIVPGAALELLSYSEWYKDDEGNLAPLIDPETVIVQGLNERNSMLYGAVTIVNKDGEFETHMEQYTPRTWFTQNPGQKFISIISRPLPMPHDIKSWYVLKGVVTGA